MAVRALIWALRLPAFLAATSLFLVTVGFLGAVTLAQRIWVALVPRHSRLPAWLRPWWVDDDSGTASVDERRESS